MIKREFKPVVEGIIHDFRTYQFILLGEYFENNGDETYKFGILYRGVDAIVKVQFTNTWIYIQATLHETGDFSKSEAYNTFVHKEYQPNLSIEDTAEVEKIKGLLTIAANSLIQGDLKTGV